MNQSNPAVVEKYAAAQLKPAIIVSTPLNANMLLVLSLGMQRPSLSTV
jgi:hypothetical protein